MTLRTATYLQKAELGESDSLGQESTGWSAMEREKFG